MAAVKPSCDVSAAAFFNMAREYRDAANQLLGLNTNTLFSNPIAFLYFHAIELALKAFLRSRGCRILGTSRMSHRLRQLYDECQTRGLQISPDVGIAIGNVVDLLGAANEGQGFRYFNLNSVAVPNLTWTREAVDGLMGAIELHVGATTKPGPPAKMRIIVGMARQRR